MIVPTERIVAALRKPVNGVQENILAGKTVAAVCVLGLSVAAGMGSWLMALPKEAVRPDPSLTEAKRVKDQPGRKALKVTGKAWDGINLRWAFADGPRTDLKVLSCNWLWCERKVRAEGNRTIAGMATPMAEAMNVRLPTHIRPTPFVVVCRGRD